MNKHRIVARKYAPWLWFLLGLFCLRVIAQPASLMALASFLPPFESWHSEVLPYWSLLALQLLIILLLGWMAWTFSTGNVTPRRTLGLTLLVVGVIYLATMVTRLILGLTLLSDHRWFNHPIPTFFHLVLASFLLVIATFHLRHQNEGVGR